MQQDFFAYDFVASAFHSWKQPITNPMDLIARAPLRALLQACQNTESALPSGASDYELFRALCVASPMLWGHPLPKRLAFLLKNGFGISSPLSVDGCDAVWKACTENLCEHPTTAWDLSCRLLSSSSLRCLLSPTDLSEDLPVNAEPVLDGAALCNTSASTWEAWKDEMEETLSRFADVGCRSAFYQLPKQYVDAEPNVYTVGQVLSQQKTGESLLQAQAFRFLSKACAERGWHLVLRVNCRAEDALALLTRTERTVGLPTLVWSTASAETRDALLDFTLQAHQKAVRCGICLSNYPSDDELSLAISAYAARYPFGGLAIFSGSDLLGMAYARARFVAACN